ncbi:MAG TPA: aminotransferase class I/II-fold pyridoxal phosphate-dependent enzyme [Chitinivibrionales bacterium]|nr:aminotransferase class I/II-fold pyridoxal phosphate-dependent enzyme [Chitinivibrionales bacterium]
MKLDAQARQLNQIIKAENRHVHAMLSEKGRNIFFPKRGILAQTAEASGKAINATIGTALEDSGSPMCLESLLKQLNLQKKNIFSYAPSPGRPEIRAIWKDMLYKKNPSLAGKQVSLPVVTSALTHGLSMAGYLFCGNNDSVVIPDLYWENYDLIFCHGCGSSIATYPTFKGEAYNVAGMAKRLNCLPKGKKIALLNFPNNPTGYTVTVSEAQAIKDALVKAADAGNDIVVFVDDAYFGLVYGDGIIKESLFAMLADAHERILAVKFDGPTKEDYVWGFRVGFVTFGIKGGTPQLYGALEAKLAGAIRGNISNASNIGQSLLLNAYADPQYWQEKQAKYCMLRARYQKMREIFKAHPEYAEVMRPLPFNSGYFMCVELAAGNAEAVRQKLLAAYDTGIIAFGNLIRIAFSSTPLPLLEKLLDNIYRAGRETRKG